jgi:hypothetical protein
MLGLYLPLLVFLGRRVYRFLQWGKLIKLPLVIVCVVVAFLAPVTDVMKTGLDMHYYCNNEHGEHIYKTATTNSIYGKSVLGSKDYLEAGFKYVERYSKGKLTRFELSGDELKRTLIESPVSEYEIKREDFYLSNSIRLGSTQILNRGTQEVLGEAKNYLAYFGWLDRVTPDLGTHVFRCFKPRVYGTHYFVLKILKPSKI